MGWERSQVEMCSYYKDFSFDFERNGETYGEFEVGLM